MRPWIAALNVLLVIVLNVTSAHADTLDALPDDQLSITPHDGHSLFNDNIDRATSTIDMIMYHLTDNESVKHLTAAQDRGVKVRIILDKKAMTSPSSKAIFDLLTQHGVEVRPSSQAFSISHAKSAVFDNSWALVTSINLTRTDWYTRDFGIRTEDSNVVAEFESVFATDWDNAQNNTGNTPQLTVGKLAWSPVNSKDKILGLINSARQSIFLEVENLGDRDVLAALENKAKSSVKVIVVVPACVEGGGTRNLPFMNELASAGVEARLSVPPYTGSNPYIHAKAITVDSTVFYVGSENFSYNSLTAAREAGIIERSPSIAATIQDTILGDARLATPSASMAANFQCSTKTIGSDTGSSTTTTPQ